MHPALDRPQLPDAVPEESAQRRCVWVEAWEGSRRLPMFKDHIHHLQKPVDWQLQGTSSWINLVSGRDGVAPKGWDGHAEP